MPGVNLIVKYISDLYPSVWVYLDVKKSHLLTDTVATSYHQAMSAEVYLRYRLQGAAIAQVAYIIRLIQVSHTEMDAFKS